MRKIVLVFLIAIFIGAIVYVFTSNTNAEKGQKSFVLAMDYIKNNTLPNGKFIYRKHISSEFKYKTRNIMP